MYCSKCGKKLNDDAKFCDGCGAAVVQDNELVVKPTQKEGKVHKCPYCGELLGFDAVVCPSCGKEIRDKGATRSLVEFSEKYLKAKTEDEKIDLIKSYPIPSTREDIMEFMMYAVSNIDVKYYVTNKSKVSISSTWLDKMEQCQQKALIVFKDERDITSINSIYDKVRANIKKTQLIRYVLIASGFILTCTGFICVGLLQQSDVVNAVFMSIMALGIVLLVFGLKRKKTLKDIEDDKLAKKDKQEMKLKKKRYKDHVYYEDEDEK